MRQISKAHQAYKSLFLVKIGLLILLLLAKSCELERGPNSGEVGGQTVLLISIDGFARDYLDHSSIPTLDSLIASGVMAESLVPVFPSKTFPNHYTQVTGLYPENHGIIANRMYDPHFREYFNFGASDTSSSKWYQGEPVWVTAKKQGKITATMFWPGSEVRIAGFLPDYYFPFNPQIVPSERIRQILRWLKMDNRPQLITLYFEQVDRAGHRFGPHSVAVREVIGQIDLELGHLVRGIVELGLEQVTNIIIVSDHGMAAINRDKVIFLDDYLDLKDVEIINWSPLLEIIPKIPSNQILERLTGAHSKLRIYGRERTPDRWHFRRHHRISPIIGLAEEGWSISSRKYYQQHTLAYLGGTHGYDPEHQSMQGIFIASGPAFASGIKLRSIESVHLYELVCKLLEIKPAVNDGDPKVWAAAFR